MKFVVFKLWLALGHIGQWYTYHSIVRGWEGLLVWSPTR